MVDRTVKTILSAQVTGYLAGMDQAARKTRETGSEIEKLAQKRQAFQTLGTAAVAFGLVVAAAIGVAIVKYAQFDQAMSNANAILQESTENQNLLKAAALDAGGATVFTAQESANAIEELGKAGIDTANILSGALRGSLDLAAAGQLGVARAAEITGITLKQFNLDGTQAGRVADVLSAGANRAVGSVDDLAQGLKFVGPVAASMGISLEDTTATLALFADQGIVGEQAGTAFRGMLASLQNPSAQAKAKLEDLGISLYDANGGFVGLGPVIAALNQKLGDVDDQTRDTALGLIFTNAQLTTAQAIVGEAGAKWGQYRDAVDDSGNAARIAAARMDNLAGDVEKLGGAFDTALIQTGSGANDVLRGMVQAATFLVDLVGNLPEPVLTAGLAIGAVAAALALAAGSAALAIPKFSELRTSMEALNITGRSASIGIGLAGGAIALAGFVLTTFITQAVESSQRVDALRDSLDAATGAVTEFTEETVKQTLEGNGAAQAARDLGVSYDDLRDAALGVPGAYEKVLEAAEKGINGNSLLAGSYDLLKTRLNTAVSELATARDEQEFYADASGVAERATRDNERALAGLEGVAASAGDQIDELGDQIRNFGSAQFDLREANRQVEQSLADLRSSLEENGHTFDITTQAGRDNQSALDEVAASYLEAAAAAGIQAGSVSAALPVLEAGRTAFIESAIAAGIEEAAANALADQLGLIPANVKTLVEANTAQATGALLEYQRLLDSLVGKQADVSNWRPSSFSYSPSYMGNIYERGVQAFASGGFPSGIYPGVQGGIHKFAESEMGVPWETYISGRAQDRDRNVGIWQKTGGLLGVWREAPRQQYAQAAAPQQQMSLEGMRITGTLDLGGGLEARIDGRVAAAELRTEQDIRGGSR